MEMSNVTAPECNTQFDVNSGSTHQPTTHVPLQWQATQSPTSFADALLPVSGDNACFWAGSRGCNTSLFNYG